MPLRSLRRGGPYFAPTVLRDKRSWFWRYGLKMDVALVAWDTIDTWPDVRGRRLKKAWGITSTLIMDSGAFGAVSLNAADELTEGQLDSQPDVIVALDCIASPLDAPRRQWRLVHDTVANARTVKKILRGRAALEVVVQGVTVEQRRYCATELARLRPQIYGVPLSGESKRRAYKDAVRKVVEIQSFVPKHAILHAMGVGSRTLMAVLGALKVTVFDSSSYYESAVHREAIPPITMCHFPRPLGKAICARCQVTAADCGRPSNPTERRVHHNLIEIEKEMIRVRCAKDEGVLDDYLQRRLPGSVSRDLMPIVRQVLGR